jgi:hypothetical protein
MLDAPVRERLEEAPQLQLRHRFGPDRLDPDQRRD